MRATNQQKLLERDELVKFQTLDRFATEFGSAPRRLKEERFTYVIIRVKQGRGQVYVDSERVMLQNGTLILVSPFAFLHLENVVYVQGTVILFTEDFFCRAPQHEHLLYKATFGPNRNTCFQMIDDEIGYSFLQSQLSMFGWEYRLGRDPLLKFDFLHNILLSVIIYIHKLQLEQELSTHDLQNPYTKSQVVQFIQLLNIHFREENTIQFYADKMNISADQLAQICKKGIGWSPKAIMQEKLLREAKRLLLFDAMSVKEVSYYLGFTEPTNFVKFFQQHTGVSPKNFRVEHCVKGLDRKEEQAS